MRCRLRCGSILDQLLVEFTTIGFLSDDNPGRRKQPVVTIAAPVFDHRQHVALMVAVHPLCPLSARQIRVIGKQLTDETTAISIPAAAGGGSRRLGRRTRTAAAAAISWPAEELHFGRAA